MKHRLPPQLLADRPTLSGNEAPVAVYGDPGPSQRRAVQANQRLNEAEAV
jgi:hypothetical protein